jgi:hypothetical protein
MLYEKNERILPREALNDCKYYFAWHQGTKITKITGDGAPSWMTVPKIFSLELT